MRKKDKVSETESLTIEKVRTFKGFENVSDEEAENIIHTLQTFAEMACDSYQEMKKKAE